MTMVVKRLWILALEVSKVLNNLSPTYIKDLFVKKNAGTSWENDLEVNLVNTITYSNKSVRFLGPETWN